MLKRSLSLVLALSLLAIATHSQSTVKVDQNSDKSPCSNIVALAGNVNINCSTLSPDQQKLLARIPTLLNKILTNQGDPKIISDKLDEILEALSRLNQTAASNAPVQVNSAPNGIAIGGGTVSNPTVNNYGPVLPQVSWKIEEGTPLPERATHPAVWIHISIDRPFLDAKFAVVCDRPCHGVDSQIIAPYGGYMQDIFKAWLPNQPDIAIFVINGPNPMSAIDSYRACVESDDDQPVKIVAVKPAVITGPTTIFKSDN
jgi:hypothetical protein